MPVMMRALPPLCAALLLAVACSGGDDDGPPTAVVTVVETPASSSACTPARATTAGDTTATITSGGAERSYILHVPPGYDGTKAMPVVLVYHGRALGNAFIAGYTLFGKLADTEGFITVFPNGTGALLGWNVDKAIDQPDDVAFTSDLLDKLSTDLCVDASSVYAVGYSNGGGMAQRLACDLQDRITAIGTVAATYTDCVAPRPWVAFHGIDDPLVPFEGGENPPELGGGSFLPARRVVSEWATGLGCNGLGQISRPAAEVELTTFVNCVGGDGEALLYSIIGGGHTWPGAYELPVETDGATTKQIDATRTMWDFFAPPSPGPVEQ
jgi:polyhydroxybutyrate depolymerase